jgi:transposase-like protein
MLSKKKQKSKSSKIRGALKPGKKRRRSIELGPVGWPTKGAGSKYQAEFCERLIEHAKNPGGTFRSFACMIGVDEETLLNWARQFPEFAAAKKRAKAIQESVMYGIGIKGMQGKILGFAPGAWIFAMKARHGWSENGPNEPDDESNLEFEYN